LIVPAGAKDPPVVVMVAQHGKAAFLKERGDVLNQFLKAGIAVCLVDVRGTGELKPGSGADRGSARTSVSQTNLMLGATVLGGQFHDLRAVIRWLQTRDDLDGSNLALWGDSFAKVNPPDVRIAVPLDVEQPAISEPIGDQLAMFAGVFVGNLTAVHTRGGVDFDTLFNSPYFAIPHDAVLPAARQIPDACLPLLKAPLRRSNVVDAQNRLIGKPDDPLDAAKWMIAKLKK
jgi:hypothetical protein